MGCSAGSASTVQSRVVARCGNAPRRGRAKDRAGSSTVNGERCCPVAARAALQFLSSAWSEFSPCGVRDYADGALDCGDDLHATRLIPWRESWQGVDSDPVRCLSDGLRVGVERVADGFLQARDVTDQRTRLRQALILDITFPACVHYAMSRSGSEQGGSDLRRAGEARRTTGGRYHLEGDPLG